MIQLATMTDARRMKITLSTTAAVGIDRKTAVYQALFMGRYVKDSLVDGI